MKTAVHLSSIDAADSAFKNVENLLEDSTTGVEHVAIVANASGVGALSARGDFEDRIRALLDGDVTVDLRACSNSLQAQGIDTAEVVSGVDVVSTGIGELTRLQAEGFAYFKVP